jgi:predicted nuclease of predicted toxin-antitoxin system
MKYLLDEHLSHRSARIGRERHGLDIVSTEELGRKQRSDEEQLAYAAAEGRVFVTQDRADFADLTQEFFETDRPHAGELLLPSSISPNDVAGVASAIARYDREHPQGMPPYMLDFLRRG